MEPVDYPPIPAFHAGTLQHVATAVKSVLTGTARSLLVTKGGHPLYLVEYGAREDVVTSTPWGSACAARNPDYYARRGDRTKPVVYLLGPVHGGEPEGISGLVNFLKILETGRDLRDRAWPELQERARRCRLLIIPCGQPDGRARCPYDGLVGHQEIDCQRWNVGERADGTPYKWPDNKWQVPLVDDVRFLGGYYNDDGVNLMHDDFFAPKAAETSAILDVARREAPDVIVSLHCHGFPPTVLQNSYAPRYVKEQIKELGDRVKARYTAAELPAGTTPTPVEDGLQYPPPTFNLVSALHHVSGALAFTFECPHGFHEENRCRVTYDQILDIQLLLYDEILKYALDLKSRPPGARVAE